MANEKFSDFTVQTNLSSFTGLVGFQTNTANYYITTSNFYDDLETNLDLTEFTTITSGSSGDVLTVNANGTGLEFSAPAGVGSISFGTTGLTPSTASTGVVSVAGTLVAANGGTGQNTYSVGDILYADTSSTLAKLSASATSGYVLTSNGSGAAPSYQELSSSGTNSYMLTGIIDGLGTSSFDFTYFGSALSGISDQGSGFSVFVNSELTHVGFKYLSDDQLDQQSTDSYVIKVYESNVNFDTLPADTLSSYTSVLTAITITGNGAGSTNYGTYPFASVALSTPLTLTAGKFYAIVGERSGSAAGLFPKDEEAQITLRITE